MHKLCFFFFFLKWLMHYFFEMDNMLYLSLEAKSFNLIAKLLANNWLTPKVKHLVSTSSVFIYMSV